MNTIFLLILALAPGFILLFFILFNDRNEREPMGLVVKVLFWGALSVAPAALTEMLLGQLPIYGSNITVKAFMQAFIQVAWVEELCKLGVVLIFAWKNSHFSEENDGIVYVGASALGFAMLENVFYVLSFGFKTGILRSISAMPLHCFSGVVMGYYVGVAKISTDPKIQRKNIFKGFFIAFVIHGLYDALLFTRTPAGILVFPLVASIFIISLRLLKKGRIQSLLRSGTTPYTPVSPALQAETAAPPGNASLCPPQTDQAWKLIVSRILLSLSIIFWALIFIGVSFKPIYLKSGAADMILGGIILTFFPIFFGVALEISYRRKKQILLKITELQDKGIPAAAPGSLPAVVELDPPGQSWRCILSRVFLSISGLFWAILMLAFISGLQGKDVPWNQMVMGGVVFTFFPIYFGFLLQYSFQERKRFFNTLRETMPLDEIKPGHLAISPRGQLWKILISRLLFGFCGLIWTLGILGEIIRSDRELEKFFFAVFSMMIVTVLPLLVGFLLEKSYRKSRKMLMLNDTGTPSAQDRRLRLYYERVKSEAKKPGDGFKSWKKW